MKPDKVEVATRLLVAMVGRGEALPEDHSIIAKWCWSMADAMQAEADKRVVRGVPESLEWQPDWSQAPENAVEWVKLTEDSFAWLEQSGFGDRLRSFLCYAPSFGYIGSIENSLRKRPELE